MKLSVNTYISNTHVEGPGLRDCIYLQGCLKMCRDCISYDTWSLDGGKEVEVEYLADKILSNIDIEGVTFSGGEPLLQSRGLYELGKVLKENKLTITVFTGYSYDIIRKVNNATWNNLLSITDLLITGPYNKEEACYDRIWIGSRNQEYHFLTDRYKYLEKKLDKMKNKVELRFNSDGSIIVNGIADSKEIRKIMEEIK